MVCGSGMNVAQLRAAVKKKQPNLAVSRLNKPALLAFYEGRKKSNPVIPKSGPVLVKKLTAKANKSIASKAPKIPPPLKAPKLPPMPPKKRTTPDLPMDVIGMIRKMATDSSRNDQYQKENPHIKLQAIMTAYEKWFKKQHDKIFNDKSPNSFTGREKRLVAVVDKKKNYEKYTKQMIQEYITLHQMGCKLVKPIEKEHQKMTLELIAFENKNDKYLESWNTGAKNDIPHYKKLFETKNIINAYYADTRKYLGLVNIHNNDMKFDALNDLATDIGYNRRQCKWDNDKKTISVAV